jgi:tetratricopeptide (TPR) repeat protein
MLARVNLANGDAGAARTNLTRAATLANYDVVTLVRIALLQLQAKHLPGAAYSLDKALAERPDYLPAQALMTEVEIRQGELAKAERRARQIVTKAPKQGVGHALLGDVASARRDLPAAIENYRRAHHLDQSTDSLLRLHGVLGVKDRPAAQQLADQWLKAHPRDVAARRAVADAHARDGNIAAARSAYEALLKVTPDDAEALNNYANVLILAGDNPLALKAAELALQRKPGTPYIIGTAGWAAFKSGQTDRALQLLRDARLRDPANPDTRYFLSAVLASVGRKAEAREELEAALSGGRSFASARQAEQLLATLK